MKALKDLASNLGGVADIGNLDAVIKGLKNLADVSPFGSLEVDGAIDVGIS